MLKLLILKFLLLFFLSLFSVGLNAQVPANSDSAINALVKKHIRINERKQSMPGYRVQIYFGARRDKAIEIKNDFTQNYPDIPAYLLYRQPNFKVRLGDCKTRLEALKILNQVKKTYEVAFIVKDDVKLPVIE